jgi:hypothetical protein
MGRAGRGRYQKYPWRVQLRNTLAGFIKYRAGVYSSHTNSDRRRASSCVFMEIMACAGDFCRSYCGNCRALLLFFAEAPAAL